MTGGRVDHWIAAAPLEVALRFAAGHTSLRLSDVRRRFVCPKLAFTSSVRSAPSLPVFEVPSLCPFEVGLYFVYPKCAFYFVYPKRAFTSSIRSAPSLPVFEVPSLHLF